jgi:ribosomal protein L37E
MSKRSSNTETIICKNCGAANPLSKALAKRYFEGYKPLIPMTMSSGQRQNKQHEPPRCRVCKQILT